MKSTPRRRLFALLFLAAAGCAVWLFASPGGEITPPSAPIPLTFFGLHMHWADTNTPWPPVPFGSWRLWDSHTTWAQLEPRKGEWNWQALDKDVALAERHNVEILLTLGRSPQWASARPQEHGRIADIPPGGIAEPRNLEDWRDYIRTVATRYKGRIHEYEVWNEPNLPNFFSGTPEAMRDLAREAYTTLKQVDPENIVVSPSAVGPPGLTWMQEYLQLGGGKYADVIGWHFYLGKRPPEAIIEFMPHLRSVLEAGGVGDKPLWNTEAGWTLPTNVDPSEGPAYVARSYILNWGAGVGRFYWYAWDDQRMSVVLTEQDRASPSPAGRAYGEVSKWLVGARMESLRQDGGNFICQLSRDGAKSWIVWNPQRRTRLDIPQSWAVADIQNLLGDRTSFSGNKLDVNSSPVLLRSSNR
jgi:Glycosyl hydrolase family 10